MVLCDLVVSSGIFVLSRWLSTFGVEVILATIRLGLKVVVEGMDGACFFLVDSM